MSFDKFFWALACLPVDSSVLRVNAMATREVEPVIGGSLGAQNDNLDAYVPIETTKQRVCDLVMNRAGGEFQGEQVE